MLGILSQTKPQRPTSIQITVMVRFKLMFAIASQFINKTSINPSTLACVILHQHNSPADELERCSNPLKMRKVFSLDFGGDVMIGSGFLFWMGSSGPGPQPKRQFKTTPTG